ncbi:hypothetical protein FOCC_FOCC011910, partial [Frankliniella occidentalis]
MIFLLFKDCSPLDRDWKDWFFASNKSKFTATQDVVHTITKFRSRVSPAYLLPIGNYTISQAHLHLVLKQPKTVHGLSPGDLDKDKMNFDASVKICSTRVTDILSSTPGADGTKEYLVVMRSVMEAFLNQKLSASEKVYHIWHAVVFFLKILEIVAFRSKSLHLRQFCYKKSSHVLAHALIILIIKFRDEDSPEDLLLHLFSSQPSESYFRYARSMTTTQLTVINFTMKDFLQK